MSDQTFGQFLHVPERAAVMTPEDGLLRYFSQELICLLPRLFLRFLFFRHAIYLLLRTSLVHTLYYVEDGTTEPEGITKAVFLDAGVA